MFPKSNSFYLTGLFKVLCEIWLIYYMYPFDVIVIKNGAKVFRYSRAANSAARDGIGPKFEHIETLMDVLVMLRLH